MLISSKITDNSSNSGCFCIRWGICSITTLLVRTKGRAEERLQRDWDWAQLTLLFSAVMPFFSGMAVISLGTTTPMEDLPLPPCSQL